MMTKRQRDVLERKTNVLKLLPEAEALTWPKAKLGKRGTIEHLKMKTGLRDNTLGRYLAEFHDQGQARIGRWHRTAGCPAAVWVQGPGPHAEKPVAFEDHNEYSRAHRTRVRKAIAAARAGRPYDARYTRQVGAALASDTVARATVAPVTWLTALGM